MKVLAITQCTCDFAYALAQIKTLITSEFPFNVHRFKFRHLLTGKRNISAAKIKLDNT